jgi:hypothetical protein
MNRDQLLRSLIREIIQDELDETSSSGAAGAYMTPKAFGKRKPASGKSQQEAPVKFGESTEDK